MNCIYNSLMMIIVKMINGDDDDNDNDGLPLLLCAVF